MVDDAAHSGGSNTAAVIDFVNRSGRPVDIYWIDSGGRRVLYMKNLKAGATHHRNTYLTHPWLIVASDSGGTTARDTGTRLAAFEAVTPNVWKLVRLRHSDDKQPHPSLAEPSELGARRAQRPVQPRRRVLSRSIRCVRESGAEATGLSRALVSARTSFRNGSLYLNGVYSLPADRAYVNGVPREQQGYYATAYVPKLDYRHFTVALDFKSEVFDWKKSAILYGGIAMRWWGLGWRDGALELTLNNTSFTHRFDVHMTEGVWHNVICSVDLSTGAIRTLLDGRALSDVILPQGFRLEVSGSQDEDQDKLFTFTNYANWRGLRGECQ